jgi:hypothetical protein
MIGTGKDKRPKDQAIAACAQIWRDRDKQMINPETQRILAEARANLKRLKLVKQDKIPTLSDCPDPNPDEGEEDYIQRCTDQLISEFGYGQAEEAKEVCDAYYDQFYGDEEEIEGGVGVTDAMKPDKIRKLITKQPEPEPGENV